MNHQQIPCRECGAYIIFLPTASGKRMPVDAESVDEDDEEFEAKRHISHFATCSKPERFRRPR